MSTVLPDLKGVNIFLIGMMGSGKSTTGQILAKTLNYKFFDTDTVVEQLTQQSIPEIFAQSGEPKFRELETQVLSELSSYRQLVVATGGGIILNPMNWSYLRHGLVVWLNVDTEILWDRLKEDESRPLLNTADPYASLQEKLEQRTSLYQQADVEVKITKPLDVQVICQKTLEAIKTKLREEEGAVNPTLNPSDVE